MKSIQERLRASGLHLLLSLLIAALAAAVVFGLWYPYPYREISGGRELFLLVMGVDVIVGPLITLVVYNRQKSRRERLLDFSVIGLLQIAALSYGLWTVAVARPVHLVFELNRFRVVHAIEVDDGLLAQTDPQWRRLPWTGPSLLSVRPFKSPQEEQDATLAALSGVSLSSRPDLWQAYLSAKDELQASAKPLSDLTKRFPDQAPAIAELVSRLPAGTQATGLVYIPLVGRKSFWTVVLDPTSWSVQGFLPIDSF